MLRQCTGRHGGLPGRSTSEVMDSRLYSRNIFGCRKTVLPLPASRFLLPACGFSFGFFSWAFGFSGFFGVHSGFILGFWGFWVFLVFFFFDFFSVFF